MICDRCQGLRVVHDEDDHCLNCGKRWFRPWPIEPIAQSRGWWKAHDLRTLEGLKTLTEKQLN